MRLPDTTLTAQQNQSPYAKYFYRPLAEPAPELLAAVSKPMDCKDALPINDINRLLDPGYQAVETGYCVFWWFIWHPQDPLRYKIWDRDDHFDVRINAADRQRFNDPSLPFAQRLWGSTHHVRENIGIPTHFRFMIGLGGKDPYAIDIAFIPPEDCGFDMSRFDPAKETVICAASGMRHYVRKTADGVELRTRSTQAMCARTASLCGRAARRRCRYRPA